MNKLTKVLLGMLFIAIIFTAGRYSKPTKIETKEVVKIVTQREEAKTRVVYRDKVTQPDGTIIEKEVEREESTSKEVATLDKISESTTTNDSGLVISALAVIEPTIKSSDREYNIVASKRLIGALNGTVLVGISKGKLQTGAGIGWSF